MAKLLLIISIASQTLMNSNRMVSLSFKFNFISSIEKNILTLGLFNILKTKT